MRAHPRAASGGGEALVDWATLSAALDRWLDADDAQRGPLLTGWRRDAPGLARAVEDAVARMVVTEQQAFMARSAQTPEAPGSTEGTRYRTTQVIPSTGTGDRPSEPIAGDRCGAYRLLERIGSGGMGSVWLAERDDGLYEGRVAVKFLRAELSSHAQSGRFLREGQFLARLDHSHIARLLDAGVGEGGLPYWVIEHVDGLSLDAYCGEHSLDLAARVALCADVLDAVAHAHGRLILHRDLKPSNILVDRAGQVKLLDFGVGKLIDETFAPSDDLTRDHGAAYTPHYAAPEQIAGEALTTATDTYAIGLLLFALVTGRDAFPTARVGLLQRLKSLRAGPQRASQVLAGSGDADAARRARAIHGDLDTVIAKALRFEPEQRYQSAAAFAQELRRFLAFEPILARPDGTAYRLRLFVRRHRWGSAAAAGATLALMVAVGVAFVQAREADHRRDQSEKLVSFMLNDLSDSLSAAGRLSLLASTSQKILEHYASEDPRRSGRDSLANQSAALWKIGSIATEQARLDTARESLAQMTGVTNALAARWPASAETAAAGAREKALDGNVQRRSDGAEAQRTADASYRAAADLAERAYALDGKSDAMAWLSGIVLSNLGLRLAETDLAEEGLPWLVLGAERLQQAAPKIPQARLSLVSNTVKQAAALKFLARYEQCVTVALPLLSASRRMPDGGLDLRMEYFRQDGLDVLATCDLAMNRVSDAVEIGRQQVASTQLLLSIDPSQVRLEERYRGERLNLVRSLVLAGREREAAELFEPIRRELEPVLATTKGQDSGRRTNWLYPLIDVAARIGIPWEDWNSLWTVGLATRARFLEQKPDAAPVNIGPLIEAGTRMLERLRSDGPRFAREARVLETQVEGLARIAPRPSDLPAQLARAEFAFIQNRHDDARAEVERLLAMGVRHPDLLALQRRLDASR